MSVTFWSILGVLGVLLLVLIVIPFGLLAASVAAGLAGNILLSTNLARIAVLVMWPYDRLDDFMARGNKDKTSGGFQLSMVARELVAINLKELGRVDEAIALNTECLRMHEARGFKDRAATSKVALAGDYRDKGDLDRSEKLLDDAVGTLTDLYNDNRSELARRLAASNLSGALASRASLFELKRRFKDAEPLRRSSAQLTQEAEGQNPNGAIPQWSLLVLNLANQGSFAEAGAVLKDVERRMEAAGGLDNMTSLAVWVAQLRVRRQENDLDGAEKVWHKILPHKEKFRGNPGLLGELCAEEALLRAAQGKDSEAEPLFKAAVENIEKRYGKDHPELLEQLEAYAALLERKHEVGAEKLLERAGNIRSRFEIRGPLPNSSSDS